MTRTHGPGAVIVAALTGVLLSACGLRNPDTATPPGPVTAEPPPARSATPITGAQVNRQDHPPAPLVRSQRAVTAARPMLSALPITAAGVTITIGGLAPDGRTTILTLTSTAGRRHALAVYRHELRRYGDSGRAYKTTVQP